MSLIRVYDDRSPKSRMLDGSDAMNPDPDYSAAHVELRTDAADGLQGHGFSFTIGRGNEVMTAAIATLTDHVVGLDAEELLSDLGRAWRLPSTTRSCAGSARRRASCTWPPAPSSTLCGTCAPSAPACSCGACWRR
ncbi:hypothetical protein GCM10023167_25120 [Brevibacterium pityocampae]|uniref:Mandelate racemase/muconate lactonizing enzyme N-terminal domain-containing protein n=1 Tax=Brevibacterium pityocampae TaxID=506594 RepID=A0ABP8JRI0_9MICO